MKQSINLILSSIFGALSLYAAASCANELSPQIFSLSNMTVGVTTLDEIQNTFGMVEPSRISQEIESDITLCYINSTTKSKSFLTFESGAMGGFKYITGFRISYLPQKGNCVSTKIDIASLSTGNGVRLGQSLEDFKKTVKVKFKKYGPDLTYETVKQRRATREELKKIRDIWPNEKQDYFDVTILINAKFYDNKLIDFYVHKIESY